MIDQQEQGNWFLLAGKSFELNFFYKQKHPEDGQAKARWAKSFLTAGQYVWCPALNEAPNYLNFLKCVLVRYRYMYKRLFGGLTVNPNCTLIITILTADVDRRFAVGLETERPKTETG